MAYFQGLNAAGFESSEATTRRDYAQWAACAAERYQEALQHALKGRSQEAKRIFETLIDHRYFKEPQEEDAEGEQRRVALRYLVSKNYAALLADDAEPTNLSDVLLYYLKAAAEDSSDPKLWLNIGKVAVALNERALASYAFSSGLQVASTIGLPITGMLPVQWDCLRGLTEVLKSVKDLPRCRIIIEHVQERYPSMAKAAGGLLHETLRPIGVSAVGEADSVDVDIYDASAPPHRKKTEPWCLELKAPSWAGLANLLLEIAMSRSPEHIAKRVVVRLAELPTIEKQPIPIQLSQDVLASQSNTPCPAGLTIQTDGTNKRHAEAAEHGVRTSRRVRQKLSIDSETPTQEGRMVQLLDRIARSLRSRGIFVDVACIGGEAQGAAFCGVEGGIPPLLPGIDAEECLGRFAGFLREGSPKKRSRGVVRLPIFDSEERGSRAAPDKPLGSECRAWADARFNDFEVLRRFVEHVNDVNSGVVDYLLRFVVHLLSSPVADDSLENSEFELAFGGERSLWLLRWPAALRDALYHIVEFMDDDLFCYHLQVSVEGPDRLSFDEWKRRIECVIAICEIYQDRTWALPDDDANRWLTNRFIRWLLLMRNFLESLAVADQADSNRVLWANIIRARYYWAAARWQRKQDANRAESAVAHCRPYLSLLPSPISLVNCHHSYEISLQALDAQLEELRSLHYVYAAKDLFAAKDYRGVVERLEPRFGAQSQSLSGSAQVRLSPTEALQCLRMLRESYTLLDDLAAGSRCAIRTLAHSLQSLCGVLGGEHPDGDEFLHLLWAVNDAFRSVIRFLETFRSVISADAEILGAKRFERNYAPVCFAELPDRARREMISCLLLGVRLAAIVISHRRCTYDHSDAVKMLALRAMTALAMVLRDIPEESQSQLEASEENSGSACGGMTGTSTESDGDDLEDDDSQDARPRQRSELAEMLADVHRCLGEICCCCDDGGDFLSVCLGEFQKLDTYDAEVLQCYYCLHGIVVRPKDESSQITVVDHKAKPLPFTKRAAAGVYEYMRDYVLDWVYYGRALRKDDADVLDLVLESFEDLPDEPPAVPRNRDIIKHYLNAPIKLDTEWTALPLHNVHPSPTLLSPYFSIYDIYGRQGLGPVKNRSKKMQKTPEQRRGELKSAEQNFLKDVVFNGTSFVSWYNLARTYSAYAEDLLMRRAGEIWSKKQEIANCQKRAYLCFVQASRFIPTTISEQDGAVFWFDFGVLLYIMVTRPMEMAAFAHLQGERATPAGPSEAVISGFQAERPSITQKPRPVGRPMVFHLARKCFLKGYKLNGRDWRILYMLGKCLEKLSMAPVKVLWCYERAMEFSDSTDKPTSGGQLGSRNYEPLCKFLAYVAKQVRQGTLDPRQAARQLQPVWRMKCLKSKSDVAAIAEEMETGDDSVRRRVAFDLVRDILSTIRKENKWLHRATYRNAWLLHERLELQAAKEEMLKLFITKSSGRALANVWKSENERPGKRYVYISDYLNMLVDLLVHTEDLDTMRTVWQKLRRPEAQADVLDYTSTVEKVTMSYLQMIDARIPILPFSLDTPRLHMEQFLRLAKNLAARLKVDDRLQWDSEDAADLAELKRLVEVRRSGILNRYSGDLVLRCYARLLLRSEGASVTGLMRDDDEESKKPRLAVIQKALELIDILSL